MQNNKEFISLLEGTLNKNIEYVNRHGYEGMEPHMLGDLYFTNRANLKPSFLNKVFRKIEVKLINNIPMIFKPYLKLQGLKAKQLTPYALGFFLQAFAKIGDKEACRQLLCILDELSSKTISGRGVPHSDNQKPAILGKIITNKKTTYSPSTAECYLGVRQYLNIAPDDQLAKNLLNDYANSFLSEYAFKIYGNKGCFDYSNEGDETHILNASILIALCLQDYFGSDNKEASHKVRLAYNYVLEYMEGQCLPYAGVEDKYIKFSSAYDCYHTGFVLRSMFVLNYKINGGRDEKIIVDRAKKYFDDFANNGLVVMIPKSKIYDIHSLAEYVNMFSVFLDFLTEAEKNRIVRIITKSLRFYKSSREDGRYIYGKFGICKFDVYMPLWGQSAMMNGIVSLVEKLKQNA